MRFCITARHTTAVLCSLLVTVATAQAPEPPIADTRLSIDTLLREDIFAGFLQDDLARLARAERNIESLLESRPRPRPQLLAWKGATALTRAAIASEAGQQEQFRQHYRRAVELFEEAKQLGAQNLAVFAITGGAHVSIADRLPPAERAAGWERTYAAYQQLWKMQEQGVEKLPLHHKGELLTGLAQTAQRTGRNEEIAPYIDRILTLTPDSRYAKLAQQWKDDPASRASTKLTCQTCHAPGTLAARIADVA